jgi:hypothetical protein
MPTAPPAPAPPELVLTVAPEAAAQLLPLFGEGIEVAGREGGSLEEFLNRELGIPVAYLRERVQTAFLDGRAIDDLAAARAADGATVALSAAMPGLAGAVLRRGGFYADMRRQISHAAPGAAPGVAQIRVTVKLFNLVARELGRELLARGVTVPAARLRSLLGRRGPAFWDACRSAAIDGRPCDGRSAAGRLPAEGAVRLKVRTGA